MKLCILLVTIFLGGCASSTEAARAEYVEGRFPQALAQLRAIEHEPREGAEAARYALYRGLSHLALGEAREGHRWLARCRTLHAARPDLLDAEERGSLRSAWRSLGLTPGDTVGFRARARD